MHICPVCGYNQLAYPAQEGTICPSCYTEFGYDDTALSYAELRQEWLANGPRWEGINVMPAPPGWNPLEQLKNLYPTAGSTRTIHIIGTPVSNAQARLQAHFLRLQAEIFGDRNVLAENWGSIHT